MMPAVPSPPAASRSTTTTLAPPRANPIDEARPMPLPPPVTRATLPLKSMVPSDDFSGSDCHRGCREATAASVEELAPCRFETGPDIRRERASDVDAERRRLEAPQHDLRLAEQRARTHADGKGRWVQIKRAECVDCPVCPGAGYSERGLAMRHVHDAGVAGGHERGCSIIRDQQQE